MRRIDNHGLDVRDSDVDSAHFNIAAQTVAKLALDIAGSYFELAQVHGYLKNRQKSRIVLAADYKDSIRRHTQFLNTICASGAPRNFGAGSPSEKPNDERYLARRKGNPMA